MTDEYDERKWFFDRRTDKTIISKRITDTRSGEKLRIASHIVEGQPGLKFAMVKDEMVLRQTPAGRYEVKAHTASPLPQTRRVRMRVGIFQLIESV